MLNDKEYKNSKTPFYIYLLYLQNNLETYEYFGLHICQLFYIEVVRNVSTKYIVKNLF